MKKRYEPLQSLKLRRIEKGMTQERIREVMNAAEDADSSHLGVRNIHDRIRLHFGEEWGLHIESTPGQGTQITLRFPARD